MTEWTHFQTRDFTLQCAMLARRADPEAVLDDRSTRGDARRKTPVARWTIQTPEMKTNELKRVHNISSTTYQSVILLLHCGHCPESVGRLSFG